MERFNLTEPQQRQWISDDTCPYHIKNERFESYHITYETFITHLKMIQGLGVDHWKKLQKRDEEETIPFNFNESMADVVDKVLHKKIPNVC